MKTKPKTVSLQDPAAALELAFIAEYLKWQRLADPTQRDAADKIWKNAVLHAALRLEEVCARARMVEGLHA